MELHLDVYRYDEFTEIVRRLLKKRYWLDSTMSEKISYKVWYTLKLKDVRDAILREIPIPVIFSIAYGAIQAQYKENDTCRGIALMSHGSMDLPFLADEYIANERKNSEIQNLGRRNMSKKNHFLILNTQNVAKLSTLFRSC